MNYIWGSWSILDNGLADYWKRVGIAVPSEMMQMEYFEFFKKSEVEEIIKTLLLVSPTQSLRRYE